MTARRRNIGLAIKVALAALWLVAASRVHVNASWSDGAWGYAAFPLFGEKPNASFAFRDTPTPAVVSEPIRLWVWRRHSQSALIIPLYANRLPDRLNGPVPHNGYSL